MRAPRPGHGYSTILVNEALELYSAGLSCRATAAALKRRHPDIPTPSHESVGQWTRRAGILRSKTRAHELQNARRTGIDYNRVRREAPLLAVDDER
ncbi:MAG: hypothetical protein JWO56_2535 [Acidobacteria bacterium]|nr:hypothetical protein [Acidobacteriota bacterium]